MKKSDVIMTFCIAFGLGLISYKIPNGTWKEHAPDIGLSLIFGLMLASALSTAYPRNADGSRSISSAFGLMAGWLNLLLGVGLIAFGSFNNGLDFYEFRILLRFPALFGTPSTNQIENCFVMRYRGRRRGKISSCRVRIADRWPQPKKRWSAVGTLQNRDMEHTDRDIITPEPLPRLSRAAATALSIGNAEAASLANDVVRSEHLLLGLLRVGEGRAAKALKKFRLSLNEMRRSAQTLWPTQDVVVTGTLPLASQTRALINEAAALAANDHQDVVHTEHLLAAMLKRPTERACVLLEQQGVQISHVMAVLVGDAVDGVRAIVELDYHGPMAGETPQRSLFRRIFGHK